MADSKLTDLTATTAPAATDVLYVVVDPAGSPLDRKVTVGNLVPPTGSQTGYVSTSETTTSTSFTDLATAGPSVTVTVGASGLCLVLITAFTKISVATDRGDIGVAIDASDPTTFNRILVTRDTNQQTLSLTYLATGLSAGSHTFKMRYRTASGGTLTAAERTITAVPL